MTTLIEELGRAVQNFVLHLGRITVFGGQILRAVVTPPPLVGWILGRHIPRHLAVF